MIQSSELLGLIEYYDAIFNRKGLVKKESEFRTNKLSLILDLIRSTGLFDNHETNLISKIIDAWRLRVPEKTSNQREEELHAVLKCIRNIKNAVKHDVESYGQRSDCQLRVVILSFLPITPTDFPPDDAPEILDLLSQVVGYSSSITGSERRPSFTSDGVFGGFIL